MPWASKRLETSEAQLMTQLNLLMARNYRSCMGGRSTQATILLARQSPSLTLMHSKSFSMIIRQEYYSYKAVKHHSMLAHHHSTHPHHTSISSCLFNIVASTDFPISMGQNNSTLTPQPSPPHNSRLFFQQQVDIYRWRADPIQNRHIARVHLSSSATVRDQEQLAQFIQHRISKQEHVSVSEILHLAQMYSPRPNQQIMSFEKYAGDLSQLQGMLSLPQTIYCLQTLLSGYETLWRKLQWCAINASHCLVTGQGQVRAWISPNPHTNHPLPNSCLINDEVSILKRVLQVCQILPTNHTQFLHFARQCKSFMDRNIEENWTFTMLRKLTHKYMENYQMNTPSCLNHTRTQLQSYASSTPPSPTPQSSIQSTPLKQSLESNYKYQLDSTGQTFNTPSMHRPSTRPLSHSAHNSQIDSDFQRKRSLRGRHKKHSSTHNIKEFMDCSQGNATPKLIRSHLATFTPKANTIQVKDLNQSFTEKPKLNHRFSNTPEGQKSFTDYEHKMAHKKEQQQNMKGARKEMVGILKKSNGKQKTKLQKKAVKRTVCHGSTDMFRPCLVEPSIAFMEYSSPSESQMGGISPVSTPVNRIHLTKKTESTPFQSTNMAQDSRNVSHTYSRTGEHSRHISTNSISDQVHSRNCVTATMNKLLDNSDVVVQQSVGTLMSVPEGEQSGEGSYHGVLSAMGRSVDVRHIPSNKQICQKRGSFNYSVSGRWE